MEIIKRKVELVTKEFIDNLAEIKDTEIKKSQLLDKRINQLQDDSQKLKNEEANMNKYLAHRKSEFESSEQDIRNLKIKLNEEIRLQNDLVRDAQEDRKQTQNELDIAKDERGLSTEELKKQRLKTIQYQNKINALQKDDDKLNTKRRELEKRETQIKIKEKINLDNESKNIARERVLGEQTLDMRIRLKNVELAEKRIKAK